MLPTPSFVCQSLGLLKSTIVTDQKTAALMSNHSAEYPNGILKKETLKSFFAINEAADGT